VYENSIRADAQRRRERALEAWPRLRQGAGCGASLRAAVIVLIVSLGRWT
jgi:hypothetical protein